MAAGRKLGEAYIAVTADARGVADDLSKEASAALDRAARKMGETLDDSLSDSVRDSTEGLGDALGAELDKSTKRAGGRFQDQLRKSLSAAVSNLPDIELGVDASDTDVVLAGVRSQLAALRDVQIGVDLDANAALLEVATLDAVLAQLEAGTTDVDVRADTGAARRELAAVQKSVRDVGGGRGIEIPGGAAAAASLQAVSAAGRVTGNVAGFAGIALKGLIPIIAAIVLVLGSIVPTAVAAGGALLAVGTAAAAGLAVAVLGFSGVGDALKLLTRREDALASAVGGGGASAAAAASATRALANARQNAADASEDAARRVLRAQESLRQVELDGATAIGRAQREAADDVAAAVDRYRTAELGLRDALRSVKAAQDAVTEARRETARDLEDLDEAVSDNARAQRAAAVDLREARAALDYVLGNSWASDAQRAAAQLNYDEQADRMSDLERAAARLGEEQADAARKGIDGSDKVTGAQDRLRQAEGDAAAARRTAADAAAAIDQARKDGAAEVAEAREDAARREVDAARSVTDALREQDRTVRQNAYSIETALAAVATAAAGAGTAGSSALAAINRELADVDPATLAFANFIRDRVQPAWKQIKADAAGGLLPGVQKGLENLSPLLPQVSSLVGTIARTLGDIFASAGERLNSPFFRDFLTDLEEKSGPILTDLADAIWNVVEGVLGIAQAFLGLADDEKGFDLAGMTEGFAEWGRTLKDNPEFREFIDNVKETLPEIVEGVKNFGTALGDIFQFFEENGDTILDVFNKIGEGITAITDLFDGEDTFSDVFNFLRDFSITSQARKLGLALLDGILDGIGDLAGKAVDKWHDLVDGFKSFFGINSPSTVFSGFGGDLITGLIGGLGGKLGDLLTWFRELPGKIAGALSNLGTRIREKFSGAFQSGRDAVSRKVSDLRAWLTELPSKLVSSIGDLAGAIGRKGREGFQALRDAATSKVTSLREWLTDLPNKIRNAIGNVGSTLKQKGRDLIDGLVAGLREAGGFASGVAKKIVNGVIGFLNSKVIGGINDLLEFRIPITGAPDININPPDIPRIPLLADGAIVRRPTLAVVGDAGPEVVLPLSASRSGRRADLMAQAGLGGGGGITYEIDARQYYDVRDTQTAQEVGAVVGQRLVRDLRNGASSRHTGAAA